ALVESAARLCNAYDAVIFQVFGDGLRRVAHYGQIATSGPVGQLYPLVVAAWQRVPSSTGEQLRSQISWPKRMNTPRPRRVRSDMVGAPRSASLSSTQARQLG